MMDDDLRQRIVEHREEVRGRVVLRDGRLCFLYDFCGNAADDLHEIDPKRGDYPPEQQIEKVFTLENSILLCRACHQNLGQTKFGAVMFKYLLWLRHGGTYKRPDLLW